MSHNLSTRRKLMASFGIIIYKKAHYIHLCICAFGKFRWVLILFWGFVLGAENKATKTLKCSRLLFESCCLSRDDSKSSRGPVGVP